MTQFMTQRCWPVILVLLVGPASGCAEATDEAPPAAPESAAVQGVTYNGASNQFAGGFDPSNAPDGGFGGGACVATRTPVIFVHGNSVNASFFAKPSSTGGPSVYDTLKAAGYNDCELFGITYLSTSEQAAQQLNFHTSTKAARIRDFIKAVKAYTGKSKVNILAHSMGVTVAQHGITFGNLWGSIDTFVNVAGGLKGSIQLPLGGLCQPAVSDLREPERLRLQHIRLLARPGGRRFEPQDRCQRVGRISSRARAQDGRQVLHDLRR